MSSEIIAPYLPMISSIGSGLVTVLYMGIYKEKHYVSGISVRTNLLNLVVSVIALILSQFWLYLLLTGFALVGVLLIKKSYKLEHPYAFLFGGNTIGGLAIWSGLESQNFLKSVLTWYYQLSGQTLELNQYFVLYQLLEAFVMILIIHLIAYRIRHM